MHSPRHFHRFVTTPDLHKTCLHRLSLPLLMSAPSPLSSSSLLGRPPPPHPPCAGPLTASPVELEISGLGAYCSRSASPASRGPAPRDIGPTNRCLNTAPGPSFRAFPTSQGPIMTQACANRGVGFTVGVQTPLPPAPMAHFLAPGKILHGRLLCARAATTAAAAPVLSAPHTTNFSSPRWFASSATLSGTH
jgi:hypothetical protein